ncbi:hypothetical protein CCZ01_01815 [Helicobacter monodelphidis]|uniref:LPP20 family lipoprotein n=1 Tax=Helicobacter sp. 15-1451 TaxID=2004995 RepID=UPI000DCC1524|nr:LPP20 family lipoprotein [Helicobacter sp. 15-1451]RAX58952.1 hypothetical protein CCZ01_01815 [Helicobacter sp. 15-1451]
MKSIGFILCGILVSFFAACVSSDAPPLWYFEHIQNTDKLYGYGSAKNDKDAKVAALNDLSSQLQLSLQSRYQLLTRQHNDLIEDTAYNSVSISVPRIQLKEVQYSKTEYHRGAYYVRAEISKDMLVKEYVQQHDAQIKKLQYLNQVACSDLNVREMTQLKMGLQELERINIVLDVLDHQQLQPSSYEEILQKNSPKPTLKFVMDINDEQYRLVVYNSLVKELSKFYRLDESALNTARAVVDIQHSSSGSVMGLEFSLQNCKVQPVLALRLSSVYGKRGPYENTKYNATRVGVQLYKKLLEWSEEAL